MKIRDIVDRFFFARVFWNIDIHVQFKSGMDNYKGIKPLLEDCGDTAASKVEFGPEGITFFVSENDEGW